MSDDTSTARLVAFVLEHQEQILVAMRKYSFVTSTDAAGEHLAEAHADQLRREARTTLEISDDLRELIGQVAADRKPNG